MNYAIEPITRTEGTTVRYTFDSRGSTFTVRAFAEGLLSAFAHSPTITAPDFEGEVLLNPDAVERSSLRMVIQAAALTVTGDISDKDRAEIDRKMHREVIESDSFPEIVYECSAVSPIRSAEGQFWVTLNGDLSLHGVTRSQPVSARVWVNGSNLRAAGESSLRLSDYEIRPVSAAGGTIRLKDELKLSFDLSAHQQA